MMLESAISLLMRVLMAARAVNVFRSFHRNDSRKGNRQEAGLPATNTKACYGRTKSRGRIGSHHKDRITSMMLKELNLVAAATFIAFMTHAVASRADTISYADAVTTLAKECGADIKKHCKGINLGGGRIQSCLEENSAKVAPACTSTLSSVMASIQQRQEAQRTYIKVCQHDMSQYCNGVVGDGHILSCLIETSRVDGRKCDQAITDAGWR